MKNLLTPIAVLLIATLMPGLGGCEKRCKTGQQPPAPSSQPAEKTVKAEKNHNQNTDDYYTLEDVRSPYARQLDRMSHNAELADMSLTDIHFMPNRPLLNYTGTQRLNHLAWMVDHYGGTIMLDLAEPKSEMAQARIQTVIGYLKEWGLPKDKIVICFGLPQSRGMDADEAIIIYKDTRYKKAEPKKDQSVLIPLQ